MKKILVVIMAFFLLSACTKKPDNTENSPANNAPQNTTQASNEKTDSLVDNEEDVAYSYLGENDNFEARVVVSKVTEKYLTSLADESAGYSSEDLQKIMDMNPVYRADIYLTYIGDSLGEIPNQSVVKFVFDFLPAFSVNTSTVDSDSLMKILSGKEPLMTDILIPEDLSSEIGYSTVGKVTVSSPTLELFNYEFELTSK